MALTEDLAMRVPKPWFWTARNCWYLQHNGKQIRLDPDFNASIILYGKFLARGGMIERRQAERMTVGESIELFLDPSVNRSPQDSTRKTYRQNLSPFMTHKGSALLASISADDVLGWCERKHECKDGYRHLTYSVIKSWLKWCKSMDYIDRNPIELIDNPYSTSRRTTIMTRAQYDRLIGAIDDPAFRLLIRVLYTSGCRPGEAYKLYPRHLHPSKPIATLTPAEHKTGRKTKKDRNIFFPSDVMEELRRCGEEGGKTVPILRNSKGMPWNTPNVASRLKRTLKKAGLPTEIVAYTGRHSFVTDLVMAGESGMMVAKAIGHNNDRTLQEYYLHIESAKAQQMVERRAEPASKQSKEDVLKELTSLQARLAELTAKLISDRDSGTA